MLEYFELMCTDNVIQILLTCLVFPTWGKIFQITNQTPTVITPSLFQTHFLHILEIANYFKHTKGKVNNVTDCISPTAWIKHVLTFCQICFRSLFLQKWKVAHPAKTSSSHKQHPLPLPPTQPPNLEWAGNTPVCVLMLSLTQNISINNRQS